MQSRFMKGEVNPTLLVLASSKRTDSSYMESFIADKKKKESKTTLIIDEPQWVIREDKNSPNKFKVALGNKFLESEVLSLDCTEDDLKLMRDRGYRILEVPMGYYENFIDDINIALTDIAGISIANSNSYFSGHRLSEAKVDTYKNAFIKDVIEVGNAPDDTTQYWQFFNIDLIPQEVRTKPLYVHLDMSISGDKTGIAGTFIESKTQSKPNEPSANSLNFLLGFSVSVKAPKGYQISFDKNLKFILWLKENGFNIKGVSTDTFQNAATGQALVANGFNYQIISVDRVDTDRINKPYHYFRTALYEGRFKLYDKCDLLTDEILGIERDNNSGKLDHTPSGINSKDQIDAVVGSTYLASKDAEQFAYDYGETLDTIVNANDYDSDEAELKSVAQSLLSKVMMKNPTTGNMESANVLIDDEFDAFLGGDDSLLLW